MITSPPQSSPVPGTQPRRSNHNLEESLSKRRTSVVDVSQLNVLVIDDEATTRLILKNMLQKAGYRRTSTELIKFLNFVDVVAAADGPSALQLLREGAEDFHLVRIAPSAYCNARKIICDIHMPGMDGVQLLTEAKQIDRVKDIPVVSTKFAYNLPERD